MGRFSASGARLHELRQPKPANAAFRQGQPPRSRDFSLGLEHPQRAIPPACWEEPAFGRYRTASRAPSAAGAGAASASPNPPRRPRGALPASSPFRTPPATCPLKRRGAVARGAPHARHPHRTPGDIGSSPAIRRGCRPSRAFANPALRAASRAYRQTSRARGLASAADRGNPGKGPAASQGSAEAFAGTEDSRRQITASMPHASGPTDRRPRPHLSKRPRKRPWDGQLRRRKCTKRNCGAGEAPQERRRGCTRTPRKRRRSGWTGP